jgi:hypothetical protein
MKPDEPLEAEFSTEIKCYCCGRTPADLSSIFDANFIISVITPAIEQRNTQTQEELSKCLTYLTQLYFETRTYPAKLTIKELNKDPQMANQMAPRLSELLKYLPQQGKSADHRDNKSPYSIGEIRANIQEIIQDLKQNNYPCLKPYEPELEHKASLLNQDISQFQTNEILFEKRQMNQYFDFAGKEVGLQKLKDTHNNEFIRYYYQENQASIDPSDVVKVKYTYYLCPICKETIKTAEKL